VHEFFVRGGSGAGSLAEWRILSSWRHEMCKCTKLLKDYVDWCNSSASNWVGFALVSNKTTQLVSYTTGHLVLDGSQQRLTNLDDAGQQFRNIRNNACDGFQLFSDRLWKITPAGSSTKTGPFDPDHADKLGLQIDVQTGHTTLTLLSWGKSQYSGDLRC